MSTYSAAGKNRVTVPMLQTMASQGAPITMLTAYDAAFTRIIDAAGVDIILVGDSCGMVCQGREHTLGVSLDHILYHARCVTPAAKRCLVVGDLPFMSYQINDEEAVRNAGRLVAESNVHAVKLEGGKEFAPTVERIVRAGIPVMAHVGLTPQRLHEVGGFRVQGKTEESAAAVLEDALALERAGAFAIVLECIPTALAASISEQLTIPTIGIGAGEHCDGQVLVCYDLLGLTPAPRPRFVRTYCDLSEIAGQAVRSYVEDVRARRFPAAEASFEAPPPRRPAPALASADVHYPKSSLT